MSFTSLFLDTSRCRWCALAGERVCVSYILINFILERKQRKEGKLPIPHKWIQSVWIGCV